MEVVPPDQVPPDLKQRVLSAHVDDGTLANISKGFGDATGSQIRRFSLFLGFCACATYAVVKKQMLLNKRTINYKTRQTKLTNLTLPSCLTNQFICLNKKVKKIK